MSIGKQADIYYNKKNSDTFVVEEFTKAKVSHGFSLITQYSVLCVMRKYSRGTNDSKISSSGINLF